MEKPHSGIVEVELNDEELSKFYEKGILDKEEVDFLNNQYILINYNGQIIDLYRYYNDKFKKLKTNYFNSEQLGKIKPKDEYQQCLSDALNNLQMVLIKGKPGSGKSLYSLSYCFWALEKQKIDKIFISVNAHNARHSAKLGFYPGTAEDKLRTSWIGNMLNSKLGDKEALDQLIENNLLEIIPVGDIRGFETTENSVLYLPEAQNYNIDLMKLVLQRVNDNTKVIIDGDIETQVDLKEFEGNNNGMKRISDVFKGESFYGEVELKNVYRSRIAYIADQM